MEEIKIYDEPTCINAIRNIWWTKVIGAMIFTAIIYTATAAIPYLILDLISKRYMLDFNLFKLSLESACVTFLFIRYFTWFDRFTGLWGYYLCKMKIQTRRNNMLLSMKNIKPPVIDRFYELINNYRRILSVLHLNKLCELLVCSIPSVTLIIILNVILGV